MKVLPNGVVCLHTASQRAAASAAPSAPAAPAAGGCLVERSAECGRKTTYTPTANEV